MDVTRKNMDWQGTRMTWYEAGSIDHKPPLLLLHGGGGTGKAWWAQLHALSQHRRVLALDLPGFGQSDWIDHVDTVEAIGPALLPWLDAMDLDQVVAGGNSMGGRVALSMASHAPERFRGLIILDSVGLILNEVPIINPLTLPPREFMSGLVYDTVQYKAQTPYRTLQDAQELSHGRQSFARYLANGPIGPDPTLDISRLTMPTLLIWGREDRIVPVEYGRALDKALVDSELLIIEHCGHLPHIEEAGITNRAIEDFLTRHVDREA